MSAYVLHICLSSVFEGILRRESIAASPITTKIKKAMGIGGLVLNDGLRPRRSNGKKGWEIVLERIPNKGLNRPEGQNVQAGGAVSQRLIKAAKKKIQEKGFCRIDRAGLSYTINRVTTTESRQGTKSP
ncbi:hypothetical protein BY996DRAFT_6447788 [Phakopsora pachyrhizi]|nr:hypothetical protein BY996DRAFT_6447788 [Phakopsora pachyrhizi]